MDVAALMEDIGKSISARRRALSLTQKELAAMAGVSDRLVRSLEKGGARGVGLENLAAVLSPLGLGLALTGVDESRPCASAIPDAQSLAYETLLLEAVESWRVGDDNE